MKAKTAVTKKTVKTPAADAQAEALKEVTMEDALAEQAVKDKAQAEADAQAKADAKAAKEAEKVAAKAAKDAEKAAAKAAKDAEKEKKETEKAEAAAKAKAEKEANAKPARVEQNGVKRPSAGTKTGEVWRIADELSEQKGAPISLKELRVETDKTGANPNMVSSNYAVWRKFYGITGRIADPTTRGSSIAKIEEKLKAATEKLAKAQAVVDALTAQLNAAKPVETTTVETTTVETENTAAANVGNEDDEMLNSLVQ